MSTLFAQNLAYEGAGQATPAAPRSIPRLAPPPPAHPSPRAPADGLRSLTISTRRFGSADWFIIHHRGDGAELLTEDAIPHMRAEVVPVMVVAVNPMDRDLILRELTRHLDATIPPPPEEARGKLEVAELSVDLDAHRVTVDDVEVVLTSMEFKLLVTLIERRDAVQSRATLLRDVWRMSARSRTRTVDTHVKRLRDKLGTAGRYFHSVRGVGYRLSEDVAPRSDAPPASQREEGDRSPVARVVRRLLETA